MQHLLPYLLGADRTRGRRLADSQTCRRVQDIEEVGDSRHTTFFEMLRNWSLGDYLKDVQIAQLWTFLPERVGLDPARIYVSCFIGDPANGIPTDTESARIWADLPVGEPGGPDTEVFSLFPQVEHDPAYGAHCHQNCDCGRLFQLGNSVFLEYRRTGTGFEPLPRRNVDYGGGLGRIAAASLDTPDIFHVTLLWPIVQQFEKPSGRTYDEETLAMRVIADHLQGAAFLAVDGVRPGNKTQGYVMRRLIRRAVRYAAELGLEEARRQGIALAPGWQAQFDEQMAAQRARSQQAGGAGA